MLTKEQFTTLYNKGLSPELIARFEKGDTPDDIKFEEKKANEGFLASMGRSIITPIASLIARPIQTAALIAGKTPQEIDVATKRIAPYFGNDLATPKNELDVLKDVGRGFETVALGFGTGGLAAGKTVLGAVVPKVLQTPGVVGAVKTGFKGLAKEGFKEGAKIGLQGGTFMGFGQGLEQATEQPPEEAFKTVFLNTALGAGTGLVGGGVLGSATPLVVKGVSGVAKFANVTDLENKLSTGYKRILNPTARQIKVDSRFGGDSFTFLAQELPDLPISVNKDGRIVADDALEVAKQKYTAEATAYKPIIRNSGKYIGVDEIIAKAKAQARKEFDGTDLEKAELQIENEINAYLRNTPQDVNVTADGRRFITLARADDIKTYSWNRGRGWGTPEAEVWNDTNNLIGHSIKDAIEKEIPDANIRAMNKRLGQWKNAIDMLERRNGNVSGSGGKLSKYIIRATGTTVGSGLGLDQGGLTGGLTGTGIGFLTANTLAVMLANPNVRLFVVRQILRNLRKAGRTDMIQEAQKILQEQSSKYLLPARGGTSYVEKPISLPQSARETNLGLNEVRNTQIGQNTRSYISPIAMPTKQQTTSQTKNIMSNPTITEGGSKDLVSSLLER